MSWRDVHDDASGAVIKLDPVADLKRLIEAERKTAEEITQNGLRCKTCDGTDYRGSLEKDFADVRRGSRTYKYPYNCNQYYERPDDVLGKADLDVLLVLELLFDKPVVDKKDYRSGYTGNKRIAQEFYGLT